MTILSWPPDSKPPSANPLPDAVLERFAADIPGPRYETEAERAARIAANKAAILSYGPRNSAEAMMATHVILMKMLAGDTKREADRKPRKSAEGTQLLRLIRQFEKQSTGMLNYLEAMQSRPVPKVDAAILQALGLPPSYIPGAGDPAQPEQAVSTVIVPLHPAPKMLQ